MSLLKEGRDEALHSQGIMTDEELVPLLDSNRPKNPAFLHNTAVHVVTTVLI